MSLADLRPAVFRSYRALLRSCQIVFRGDSNTLSAAKKRIRSEFEAAEPSQARLEEAEATAAFMRQHIVQKEGDTVHLRGESAFGEFRPPRQQPRDSGCYGNQISLPWQRANLVPQALEDYAQGKDEPEGFYDEGKGGCCS